MANFVTIKNKFDNALVRVSLGVGLVLTVTSGCSQPLRTLMQLGTEQRLQREFVEKQNLGFNKLILDIQASKIKEGMTRKEITALYGEPAVVRPRSPQGVVTLLYRLADRFFDTPKVYLDFNEKDILIHVRQSY